MPNILDPFKDEREALRAAIADFRALVQEARRLLDNVNDIVERVQGKQ